MATITQTVTLVPSGYEDISNFTTSSSNPVSNGYADSSSGTYASFSLATNTTGYIFYTFDTSDIPASATISSVTAKGKARVNNTSRVSDTVMQLYSGDTAKGSNRTFQTTTASAQTIAAGTWTRSELSNLRLKIGGHGVSGSSRNVRFYGADVTITYTISSSEDKLYVKLNGSWVQVTKAYKKISGSWVEQSDLTTVLNAQTNYRKGN